MTESKEAYIIPGTANIPLLWWEFQGFAPKPRPKRAPPRGPWKLRIATPAFLAQKVLPFQKKAIQATYKALTHWRQRVNMASLLVLAHFGGGTAFLPSHSPAVNVMQWLSVQPAIAQRDFLLFMDTTITWLAAAPNHACVHYLLEGMDARRRRKQEDEATFLSSTTGPHRVLMLLRILQITQDPRLHQVTFPPLLTTPFLQP